MLYKAFKEMGLVQLDCEQSVFTHQEEEVEAGVTFFAGPDIVLAIHVDDFIVLGRNRIVIQDFKTELNKQFSIKRSKDLGKARDFLGIEIIRNPETGTIKLSQEAYFMGVLKRYGMEDARPNKTPFAEGTVVDSDDDDYLDEEGKTAYQAIVGSLTYGMQGTRPDLGFAVSLLSRFLTKPTYRHMTLVKGVLRYLAGTLKLGIVFSKHETKALHGYTDSDFNGKMLQGDGRSTSGYIFFLAGGPISWSSKRQSTVALSSSEAEYIGQANAIRHAIHLSHFLNEIKIPPPLPITIYADNQSAIALSKNPEFHARTKHIDTAYHFQRQKIREGVVEIVYIPTDKMAADGLTKPLGGIKFSRYLQYLRLQ